MCIRDRSESAGWGFNSLTAHHKCRSQACRVAVLLPGGPPNPFFDSYYSGSTGTGSAAPPGMPPTDLNVTNNLFASVLDASMLVLTPSHSASHTGVKDTCLLYTSDAADDLT